MTKLKRKPNFEWGSYRGVIKVKDMEDTHVVNVTHMLLTRLNNYKDQHADYGFTIEDLKDDSRYLKLEENLNVFKAEMSYRKIPENALDNAPYPFVDDDGCKRVWDYKENKFIVVPPALRFITDEDSKDVK